MNALEARIVFLPDFFTPNSNIIFKTYDFAKKQNTSTYQKKLTSIVQEMFGEWIATDAFETLSQQSANAPLVRLLRMKKEGATFKIPEPMPSRRQTNE